MEEGAGDWKGTQAPLLVYTVKLCLHLLCVLSNVLRLVTQSCLALWDPVDWSPPGSFVHGDSPGKNTRVGCHALFQRIFPTWERNPGLQPRSPSLPSESWGKPKENTGNSNNNTRKYKQKDFIKDSLEIEKANHRVGKDICNTSIQLTLRIYKELLQDCEKEEKKTIN